MSKQIILRLMEDDRSIIADTDFSGEEILEAADLISDGFLDRDELIDDQRIVDLLQEKGYIKVIGPAPETIDIMY